MGAYSKWFNGLPILVKFLFDLLWDIPANIDRLARSVAKKDVLGIVLAILLLVFGGFVVLWIVDEVFLILGKKVWWLD